MKDKKGVSIVNAFQKILDKSGRKPNKIRVDKGSEFYNDMFKRRLTNKAVDVKNNTYTDSNKEVNDKNPQFKVGDHVRISKYKKYFC